MALIKKYYNINIDTGSGLSTPIIFNTSTISVKYDEYDKIIISIGNNQLTSDNIILDTLYIDNTENFFIIEYTIMYPYLIIYIHNKGVDLIKNIYKLPSVFIPKIDNNIDIILHQNKYDLKQLIKKINNKLEHIDYPNKIMLLNKLNNLNIDNLDNQRLMFIMENLKKQFIL